MRPMTSLACAVLTTLALTSVARAERVCTVAAADPAITVALHVSDEGMVQGGEVHWAVPNVRPDLPSMVHIVYPLDGDHAAARPLSVITLNAVTGEDIGRSPTASIQIVVDGVGMALRAWDLYGQAVAQLNAHPPEGGVTKASFVGAVDFGPTYDDGRRDIDSTDALTRIGRGAHTLEVRLLGQDGMALQDHTYHLFDMPTPAARDVRTALAASLKMVQDNSAQCQMY